MRLAAYNVENLFDRAKVMNLDSWEAGRPILEDFAALNVLLAKLVYSAADKAKMAELIEKLGLEKSDQSQFVLLRRNRGALLKRPRDGGVEILANGRADWVGSLELRDEPIRHSAVVNTARIIVDVGADVIGVVEAEDRPSLREFNRVMIPEAGGDPYRHVMVIDGNDGRGIDLGLMTRDGYAIEHMRSHVDDRLPDGGLTFSRDCPQYEISTPRGRRVVLLLNHFKSKGYGSPAQSTARRRAQAERVKAIYDELVAAGKTRVAILGDFNDIPESSALSPLLGGTDLKDVQEHPEFDDGGYKGTYGACGPKNKIDYILLSPDLYSAVKEGGINRRGMWPGVRARRWDVIPELIDERDVASDHAALWVDLDV